MSAELPRSPSDVGGAVAYFWSGSNRPGEILALARHGLSIGVAVDALDRAGRAMRALLALAAPRRIVVNVARASGDRPILMIDRRRDADLPTGDVLVDVAGRLVVLGFRKIAVNVARAAEGGANLLGSLLRGLFGDDAGERGAGHRCALERTPSGWRLTSAELDAIRAKGSRVFVDSGAFGEVQWSPELGRMVDVRPISDADWRERLDAYEHIAGALGDRAFLVAPDKVGDQAETLRRLELYAPRIRRLRELGANLIVPIQRGELDGAAFDRECSRVLGFDDYVRGVPSKKAAASIEEIAALSHALPSTARVHLLGLGPFGDRYDAVITAIARAPELITCDSVRLKALVGRKNGPGYGPRILTRLTDRVKEVLGLVGKRLTIEEADRVKFESLDLYFARHFGEA